MPPADARAPASRGGADPSAAASSDGGVGLSGAAARGRGCNPPVPGAWSISLCPGSGCPGWSRRPI